MKTMDVKSPKGAISVFVLVSMIFFLTTIMGIYMISSRRAQTQTESVQIAQSQYYEADEENSIYVDRVSSRTTIPIYTKEQLEAAKENKAIEVDGVIYPCSDASNYRYELQNDIVIDIDSLVPAEALNVGSLTLVNNGYKIYYYKQQENGVTTEKYYTFNGTAFQEANF